MKENNPLVRLKEIGVVYDQRKLIMAAMSIRIYAGVLISRNESVIVKEVIFSSQNLRKQFDNQLQVLSQLNSPYTVKLITSLDLQTKGYIVMQDCSDTLKGKLKNGPIEAEKALSLFREIVMGCLYMKEKFRYLHNDIKPEHIFICDGHAKLGGFSAATKLTPYLRTAAVSPFSQRTFLYKAPQVDKDNEYSQKSDVWSLGVLFYELLVGENAAEWLKRGFSSLLIPHSNATSMMGIISPCLEAEPARRWELGELLEAVKREESGRKLRREEVEKMRESVKLRGIFENECRFVELLEYLRRMVGRSLPQLVAVRLDYLIEYSIRMRLHLATYSLQLQPDTYLRRSLLDKLDIFAKCHSYPIHPPPKTDLNDRLQLFKTNANITYSDSLLWQVQADLRETIATVLEPLRGNVSEGEVARSEGRWRVIDFLLSWYVLNQICIEEEEDLEHFASASHLEDILAHPTRVTPASCTAILNKAKDLQILQTL